MDVEVSPNKNSNNTIDKGQRGEEDRDEESSKEDNDRNMKISEESNVRIEEMRAFLRNPNR